MPQVLRKPGVLLSFTPQKASGSCLLYDCGQVGLCNETGFYSVTQLGVQCHNHSSLQPQPLGPKQSCLSLPKTGSRYVAQGGLKLMDSSKPPTSASQSAGIIGVSYLVQPRTPFYDLHLACLIQFSSWKKNGNWITSNGHLASYNGSPDLGNCAWLGLSKVQPVVYMAQLTQRWESGQYISSELAKNLQWQSLAQHFPLSPDSASPVSAILLLKFSCTDHTW
ncbi:hypothetical protein AAY473_024081 [Plecturocebus cupreus]